MLTFAKNNVTPPGGFKYEDEDTKQKFEGPTLREVTKAASLHRTSNSLIVPPNFEEIIEDWMCRHAPPGICKTPHGHVVRSGSTYSTASSAIRSTSIASKIMRRSNRKPVPQKTASDRASICSQCAGNLPMAGCMSCRGVKGVIQDMRGGKGTKYDKRLHVCGGNGLLNHVQVFFDAQTVKKQRGG